MYDTLARRMEDAAGAHRLHGQCATESGATGADGSAPPGLAAITAHWQNPAGERTRDRTRRAGKGTWKLARIPVGGQAIFALARPP